MKYPIPLLGIVWVIIICCIGCKSNHSNRETNDSHNPVKNIDSLDWKQEEVELTSEAKEEKIKAIKRADNDFVTFKDTLSKTEDVPTLVDVKIKADDTIKNCLITSSFENKELDEILSILEAIANIKNEKKGKIIRLTGPGC